MNKKHIEIFEYPNPICEIKDTKNGNYIIVDNLENAYAIINSLIKFTQVISEHLENYYEENKK